jgi:hypothetical protein
MNSLFEAEWFQKLLERGIEFLRDNTNAMKGILTALGGGSKILAGILHLFFSAHANRSYN